MSRYDKYVWNRLRAKSDCVVGEIITEHRLNNPPGGIVQYPYDKKTFDKGVLWYENGCELEEADAKLQVNSNFVRGYTFACRKAKVDEELYNQGYQTFIDGTLWEDVCEKFRNSEFFKKGYEDAKCKCRKK